jgi:hypothetical protein
MLFLARLVSPNGTPYWVGLAFDNVYGVIPSPCAGFGEFSQIGIRGCTMSAGTFFHPSATVWYGDQWRILRVDPNCHGPFRFYAGQPDPANPSRFTIDYTYQGNPGTIDGSVGDGGNIILTPRQGVLIKDHSGTIWNPVAVAVRQSP